MKKRLMMCFLLVLLFSCRKMEERNDAGQTELPMNHEMGADELHLSDEQIQLGNITVDSVRENILSEEYLFTGTINVDADKVTSVSSRAMGRIDKIYLRNTGDLVKRGEPIYEIYSDDIILTIKEFQLAKEKNRLLGTAHADIKKIVQSAISKLRLYGLSEEQIKGFERTSVPASIQVNSPVTGIITSIDKREGDYVQEGESIFHLADFSTLWVEGQVYSDYLNYIREGMSVKITFPGLALNEADGKISLINPELNPFTKINYIRIIIENTNGVLKPGMQADVNILAQETHKLAVPTDAIIMEENGAVVWVKTGHNMFKSKMITTGIEANGFTEIRKGLNKGDIVVITGVYLLNSEFIFRKGKNPMKGHDMMEM